MLNWRKLVIGSDQQVPVTGGELRRYVNLDNAASTPPLRSVAEALAEFLPWYSSVHRGTGFKSLVSTRAYEAARQALVEFVGADPSRDVAIFTKHTTEAINMVARLLTTGPEDVVLTTEMEHHSNLLPWRQNHFVDYIRVDNQGHLDEEDLEAKLARYRGRVRLVAVSGASNVTGYLPDLHRIAARAHEAGALLLADVAQLVPHRRVDMASWGDPGHLDFLAFSGHKLYAPYGAGALVGPRCLFEAGVPLLVGGGTVDIVTLEETMWNAPPERHEGGSPNVVGAVALGVACRVLAQIGFETIAEHERALTTYALDRLAGIPGLRILGPDDPSLARDRIGVIAFNVDGMRHSLIAAVLGYEHAIGVRAGCFCAHPYVLRLLRVGETQAAQYRQAVSQGKRSALPGAVRISFGLYNDRDDVDAAIEALEMIQAGGIRGRYVLDERTGEHVPSAHRSELDGYLPVQLRIGS